MTGIAKIDSPVTWATELDLAHPAVRLWADPGRGLLARIQAAMRQRQAHAARTLVLLPYAHLRPLAARLWAQVHPDGFTPQFETTLNWSQKMGGFAPGATDIRFDMALDTLTATALLRAAGLGDQQQALAARLVQAAQQLAPLAAACPPAGRTAWAQQARFAATVGMESPALALEAAVARIAVEWAAQSSYASDCLFNPAVQAELDCLVLVQGLATDPLPAALASVWGERLVCLPLATEALAAETGAGVRSVAWHACHDTEDEAQRTSTCVIAHIAAGRYPMALVSSDRALTRRVLAMLQGAGVQIRDETGWKLSTSHAAAQLMALLKAAVWNASSDAVLAWLKGAPALAAQTTELERALRKDQCRDWRAAEHGAALLASEAARQLWSDANAVRDGFKGTRTLVGWLHALRAALQASGLWEGWQSDTAGQSLLAVLRLAQPALPDWERLVEQALWAGRRLDLSEFTNWVNQALEGASFSPPYPAREQAVILPMSQMLARPFAAVVLAGCDEVRLDPAPEPPGDWTAAQRAALGLPTRDALQAATAQAWWHALQTPVCDVLWRLSDDAGETLMPSALVQQAQAAWGDASAEDPRPSRAVALAPVPRPLPLGTDVPVAQLSASAYSDLRQCPYRFFALRQLGLQGADELEVEVDKRDFGLWLHEVLKRFHETLATPGLPTRTYADLLDAASAQATAAMGLGEGEFLPFAAAWPTVRDGYVRWLLQHQATGAVFDRAEVPLSQPLATVKLVGRIDRIDRLPDGTALVVDYKTESAAKSASRVKEPLEDTQMAFYAALLGEDAVQGAYVNVGERDGTKAYPQPDLAEARDALVHGIQNDLARIAQGAPLPALGDGAACDYCQARGLCRKDFWS
jgi:ATP-dependent helicase/nuclease subunit B